MSTLKTNNIEHLDASTPAIQVAVGGGVNITGVTTVGDNLTIDGVNRNITTGVGQTVGFGTDISIGGNLKNDGNSFVFPSSGGTLDRLELAGNILQVVTNSTTTEVSSTTASYVDTGLSASITPTSSSSKIIVIINQQSRFVRTSGEQGMGIKVLRDSTEIYTPPTDGTGPFQTYSTVGSGTNTLYLNVPISIVDTPNTTSQVTYKTQGRPYTDLDGGQIRFQTNGSQGDGSSHITLLEVSA